MSLLELHNAKKIYYSTNTLALDGLDFCLEAGTIHVLAGENAAGKSTLAKIICGFENLSQGSLFIDGKEVQFKNPSDAEKVGISFVPQYTMLVPSLSAMKNVFLAHEERSFGIFTNNKKMRSNFLSLCKKYNLNLNPDVLVKNMSISEQRQLEILRALCRGGKIIVLDEPSSILGEAELLLLFDILRTLRKNGFGIILISHRATEISNLADKVSIMDNGKIIKTLRSKEITNSIISKYLLVNNKINENYSVNDKESKNSSPLVFTIKDLNYSSYGKLLKNINISICAGQIISIISHDGNGLDTLEDIVSMFLFTKDNNNHFSLYCKKNEVSYIPTDREKRGLCLRASVEANFLADKLQKYSFKEYAFSDKAENDAHKYIEQYEIKNWKNNNSAILSGGNRQRLLLCSLLKDDSKLIIACNPFQGLDNQSHSKIIQKLIELKNMGKAIMIFSQDPEDDFEYADIKYALYRGSLKKINNNEKSFLYGFDSNGEQL